MSHDTKLLDRLRQQQVLEGKDTAPTQPLDDDLLQDVEPTKMHSEQIIMPSDERHDVSGMAPEAKRALVNLLRHGVLFADQKMHLFEVICRHQEAIRHHFANMYLKLMLDEKAGVAFVASMNHDDEAIAEETRLEDEQQTEEAMVSLISRRTLSLYDTLVLLVLRKHYQERETSGEQKVMIDIERVESNLTPFLPLTNSAAGDRKRLNTALLKMVERRILSTIRGSDDRFEITPIIRYVVNAEFLEKMLNTYQEMASNTGITLETTIEVPKGTDDE